MLKLNYRELWEKEVICNKKSSFVFLNPTLKLKKNALIYSIDPKWYTKFIMMTQDIRNNNFLKSNIIVVQNRVRG